MNKVEEAITEWWGERCPETSIGCPVCEAWHEYDQLRLTETEIDDIIEYLNGFMSRSQGEARHIRQLVSRLEEL